ncbi:histone acetyltransferase mst2 [Lentinula edodes]|uniref:Histone acetyltransferase mst2 n=1 Tax=Lentinula edodes TaxID=5353 RepID=A0A1Q3EKQ1_LENED|nr:histone acetyltransferase mst2 [Lentinula edodes]
MRASALSIVPESEPATSDDHGTPMSNLDDIPIDPALMDSADKLPIFAEHNGSFQGISKDHDEEPDEEQSAQLVETDHFVREYSQGPQGDPFAPQPQPVFFQPPLDQPQLLPSQKSMKRKRKQKRDASCDACSGNDAGNRDGDPETMLSCVDCGRNCHPSLRSITTLQSYPLCSKIFSYVMAVIEDGTALVLILRSKPRKEIANLGRIFRNSNACSIHCFFLAFTARSSEIKNG